MADPQQPIPTSATSPLLRRFQQQAASANSAHVAGLLTLLLTGSIVLLLTGLTVAATVAALLVFSPFIIVSSPLWVPAGTLIVLLTAGFVSSCAIALVTLIALSWMYRYFRGLHPPGSDRVDLARTRIYDTATHVKDYAREYGGFLHTKVKDAAPGA